MRLVNERGDVADRVSGVTVRVHAALQSEQATELDLDQYTVRHLRQVVGYLEGGECHALEGREQRRAALMIGR